MTGKVSYYPTKEKFIESVKKLLAENPETDIMISGIWNKSMHEDIIRLIIENQCCSSCRVIIPKLLFKGDISLSLLRNVCKAQGQVRVNNTVTNNLLVIGDIAYILSFSSRLNSLNMLTTSFECAVMTDDEAVVNELKAHLDNTFKDSVLFRM